MRDAVKPAERTPSAALVVPLFETFCSWTFFIITWGEPIYSHVFWGFLKPQFQISPPVGEVSLL